MDLQVPVTKVTRLRNALRDVGLDKHEVRQALSALVKDGVMSMEDLSHYNKISSLPVSPTIRAAVRKVSPPPKKFNPQIMFASVNLFNGNTQTIERTCAALARLGVTSWSAFLEVTRADLEVFRNEDTQEKEKLELFHITELVDFIKLSREIDRENLEYKIRTLKQKVTEAKALFDSLNRDLDRIEVMADKSFPFPSLGRADLDEILKKFADCSEEIKNLSREHIKRDDVAREKAHLKALVEYEEKLPSLLKIGGDDTVIVEATVPTTSLKKEVETLKIEDRELDKKYFHELAGKEHAFFVSSDPSTGPLICIMTTSASRGPSSGQSDLLIKTREKDSLLQVEGAEKFKDMPAIIRKYLPANFQDKKLTKVKSLDSSFGDAILRIESQLIVDYYKFGILYVKKGQTEENAMYANLGGERDYEEFLNFIGSHVILKGFTGYAGGLDVSGANRTGKYSIYETIEEMRIMFHVATLLPDQEGDEQKLERKRHLGNDVVCLIFLESDEDSFDPAYLTTQFTYVFFIVSVDQRLKKKTGETYYRLSIASKVGVRSFGPAIPKPALFRKNKDFKSFLLTKLVNAERAAMSAPFFAKKATDTRDKLFSYEIEQAPKE